MSGRGSLVVFHSVSGHTEAAAETVAEALGAALERIKPVARESYKPGFFGKLVGAFRARLRRSDPVLRPRHDPADFDLVVVATPIWAGRMTPALRGWFDATDDFAGRLALIATAAASAPGRAVADVTALAGRPPEAVLHLTDRDRRTGEDAAKIAAFVDRLKATAPAG